MNKLDKIKQQIANLKAQARDMQELSAIQLAFELGQESKDGSLGIIAAKIDKLYSEVIDKKYGK